MVYSHPHPLSSLPPPPCLSCLAYMPDIGEEPTAHPSSLPTPRDTRNMMPVPVRREDKVNALTGGQLFGGYLGETCASLEGPSLGQSRGSAPRGASSLVCQLLGHGLRDTALHRSGSEVCKWGHALKAPLHPPLVVTVGSWAVTVLLF